MLSSPPPHTYPYWSSLLSPPRPPKIPKNKQKRNSTSRMSKIHLTFAEGLHQTCNSPICIKVKGKNKIVLQPYLNKIETSQPWRWEACGVWAVHCSSCPHGGHHCPVFQSCFPLSVDGVKGPSCQYWVTGTCLLPSSELVHNLESLLKFSWEFLLLLGRESFSIDMWVLGQQQQLYQETY